MVTVLTHAVLVLVTLVACVRAKASCPEGYKPCGTGQVCCGADGEEVEVLTNAVPPNCPPFTLFTNPGGVLAANTECCSNGKCAINASTLAIKNGEAVGQYIKGRVDPYHGGLWMRYPSSCEFEDVRNASKTESCGWSFKYSITKFNDQDRTNSVVKALHDAVNKIVKVTLVRKDPGLWWHYTVDTEAAKKVIEDNMHKMSSDDVQKLNSGGAWYITWGYEMTAWQNFATPAVSGPIAYARGDVKCYDLPKGIVATEPFNYEDVSVNLVTCLYKCPRVGNPKVEGCSDKECDMRSAEGCNESAGSSLRPASYIRSTLLPVVATAALILLCFA